MERSQQSLPAQIDALTFDSFPRDSQRDIVCVAPVRTIVRREEEILLIRRIRKIEEIDAGPACPVGSTATQDASVMMRPAPVETAPAETTPIETVTPPVPSAPSETVYAKGELYVHANREFDPEASFINTWGKPITVKFDVGDEQQWNYGGTPGHDVMVSADGHVGGDVRSPRFPGVAPAALVAVKHSDRDHAVAYGKHQAVTLEPDETLYFMINDQPGYYGDNVGVLTIHWAIVE
jgi:hypothetical protein